MDTAKLVTRASLTHDTENKKLNFITYGLKGVASAGITALVLSRFWKPTLTKLSLASLACTTMPVIPFIAAEGIHAALGLPDNTDDWRFEAPIVFGPFSAGIMGGAQIAFLGGAAMRIWNGAFSGLSAIKKAGIGLAIGVSVAELAVMKGILASAGIHANSK